MILQRLLAAVLKDPQDPAARRGLVARLKKHPEDAVVAIDGLVDAFQPRDLDPEPGDERFARTEFVVEATDYERLTLWRENEAAGDLSWHQESLGLNLTLGRVGNRPVCMTFFWARLDGHLVMFWDFNSEVTDLGMARRWLAKHCNPYHGGREASTNAMNFQQVRHYCGAKGA